jgi:phosphoglycerate dehydrogenase-like enzyme/glyoxylase-like metal-dependent hydrolase (beta-lactamase superfamily II)
VVDTAFPAGAERALQSIRATTKAPIRYAVMTHHHADHSFGSGAFAAVGATVIAQENAARQFRTAAARDYAARRQRDPAAKQDAHAPDITFKDRLSIAAGDQTIELLHFGAAHTAGDLFVWLPERRILCTGNACTNGPMAYLGDADTASWIDVLGHAQALGPTTIVPGHGAIGGPELLAVRRRYLGELRDEVARHLAVGKRGPDLRDAVEVPTWKTWTDAKIDPGHVARVEEELTRGVGAGLHDQAGQVIAVPMLADGTPPPLVFVAGPMPDAELAALRALAANVEIVIADSPAAALVHAERAHGIDGRFAEAEFLRRAKQLRWVQAMSAGVERLVGVRELVDGPAVLTNMAGMYGTAIADHTLGMVLSLTRALPQWLELQRGGAWGRDAGFAQDELHGKTMLVLGLGGIGREVAKRAHGFGMRVLATQTRPAATPAFVERIATPDATDALLADADVVVICLPLTPQTKGLFDRARLARMKPGALLVNIARGAIVDTNALVEALDAGHLGGAALDVVDPEPLPEGHPLWSRPRVILTPHVSGRSPLSERRRFELFAENLRRFARGLPLLNVVDKQAGY